MTAAPLYVDHGYSDFDGFRHGSLTTTSFDIDDVTYTVKVIEANGWIYIGFDKEMPIAFTLEVDGTRLASSDASFTSYSHSKIYEWEDAQTNWSEGDDVELIPIRCDHALNDMPQHPHPSFPRKRESIRPPTENTAASHKNGIRLYGSSSN